MKVLIMQGDLRRCHTAAAIWPPMARAGLNWWGNTAEVVGGGAFARPVVGYLDIRCIL
jgi:hypothetical protein